MARSNSFAYIGFAPQTVIGTPAAAPLYFLKWRTLKGSIVPKVEVVRDGESFSASSAVKLTQEYKIDVGTYLTPTAGAALFFYALSATDVKTGASDPFTHSGSEANVLLTPLTVWHSMGNQMDVVKVQDCYITDLKLASKGGALVSLDASMVGGLAVPGQAPSTVTFDADRELQHADASFTFSGISATGGDVTMFNLQIKNTVNAVNVPSIFPAHMPGKRDISIATSQFVPDTKVYRDVFFGGDTGTVESPTVAFASSIVAIWDLALVPDHQVSITMNNVAMTDAQPDYDVNGKEFLINPTGTVLTRGGSPAIALAVKNGQSTTY